MGFRFSTGDTGLAHGYEAYKEQPPTRHREQLRHAFSLINWEND
jgi:hypothetical protein